MKRIAFVLIALMAMNSTYSQTNELAGVVTYESTRKVEIKLQGEASEMANLIPKERKSTRELLFNGQSSLYRNAEQVNEDEVVQETAGGNTVVVKLVDPELFIFYSIAEKKKIEQREFMSRNFLIESSTDTVKWKLTENKKNILDYSCLEAELIGSDKKTIAWFAPSLPVSTGPEGYVGLPGLILSLDINSGETSVIAKKVELKAVDTKIIKEPNDGKKVTRKEFNKIVAEKTKEMESGGGGVFIIRREN